MIQLSTVQNNCKLNKYSMQYYTSFLEDTHIFHTATRRLWTSVWTEQVGVSVIFTAFVLGGAYLNQGALLFLGHGHFLLNSFQFIFHQSSHHYTLYNLDTD